MTNTVKESTKKTLMDKIIGITLGVILYAACSYIAYKISLSLFEIELSYIQFLILVFINGTIGNLVVWLTTKNQ